LLFVENSVEPFYYFIKTTNTKKYQNQQKDHRAKAREFDGSSNHFFEW